MHGFVSTRGGQSVTPEVAILTGMPVDGGLFVPTRRPHWSWPPPEGSVPSIADWVCRALLPGLDPELVRQSAAAATDFGFPLVEVEPGRFVLELFHGPTHAFKDVGARFMAQVVSGLMAEMGREATVLVATSGDTGGAVAHAFFERPGTRVVVLFPEEGVSERQRRQMTTLGRNITAVAVRGTFDDCQRMVKESFASRELRDAHGLTSANSINVARLLPQAIYYVVAAVQLGGRAHFVVPSGNLGNLCAGLIAATAGMPAAGFTAATNANGGFAEYLAGASFVARPSIRTPSNAMDVGDPSNLERIRWLFGSDEGVRNAVRGVSVTDRQTLDTMRALFDRTGYLLDPHGAVAYRATEVHDGGPEPVVVLATAHPGKFPDVVERATGEVVAAPPGIQAALEKDEAMDVVDPNLQDLITVLEHRP